MTGRTRIYGSIIECEATKATALEKIAAHRHISENFAQNLCYAVRRTFRKEPPPDEMIAACVRRMGAKTTIDEIAKRIKTSKTYAKWLSTTKKGLTNDVNWRHATHTGAFFK